MKPCLVLADGPFVDESMVQERAAIIGAEVRLLPLDTPTQAAASTNGADAVLVVTNSVTREIMEAFAPTVKAIGRAGVGLDAIDLKAAEDRGLAVLHTPDYCVEEVATHTIALILALSRNLVAADSTARSAWSDWRELAPVLPLHDQRVGIVGLGRIGRAVATKVLPLVSEVWGYDPQAYDDLPGIRRAETLEELLTEVDVVTLHIPLTSETERIINDHTLGLMKPTAQLVNVSRGGLVDEGALISFLNSGRIARAALDVLEQEPPDAASPLLANPRIILSPHFAWYSTGSERRLWDSVIAGLEELLDGRSPTSARIAVPMGTPTLP